MKVLVTGGAGFIGSHIAEYFAEAGHTVRILDNLITGFRKNIPHPLRWIFLLNLPYIP